TATAFVRENTRRTRASWRVCGNLRRDMPLYPAIPIPRGPSNSHGWRGDDPKVSRSLAGCWPAGGTLRPGRDSIGPSRTILTSRSRPSRASAASTGSRMSYGQSLERSLLRFAGARRKLARGRLPADLGAIGAGLHLQGADVGLGRARGRRRSVGPGRARRRLHEQLVLDASVLLPSVLGRVVADGLVGARPAGGDAILGDPLAHQVLLDRVGAVLRQLQVVLVLAL